MLNLDLACVDEIDLEVQRECNRLVADRTRLEAILADSCQYIVIYSGAGGLNNLQVGGLSGLINDHAYGDRPIRSDIGPGLGIL